MRWRIWQIANGCAAQQLVARRDVIAPEFISDDLVPGNQQKALSQAGLTIHSSRRRFAARLNSVVRRSQSLYDEQNSRRNLHLERSSLSMKVLNWIIALLGFWVFADIVALFIPDFGTIPDFLWNHIIVGLILMIVGIWAARTSNASTAKTMNWIAAGAGLWLMASSFVLRYPVIHAGLWNDLIVGAIAFVLGIGAALTSPRLIG